MPRLGFPFVFSLLAITLAVLFSNKSYDMATAIPEGQSWAEGPCALVHTPQFDTKKVGSRDGSTSSRALHSTARAILNR